MFTLNKELKCNPKVKKEVKTMTNPDLAISCASLRSPENVNTTIINSLNAAFMTVLGNPKENSYKSLEAFTMHFDLVVLITYLHFLSMFLCKKPAALTCSSLEEQQHNR